ncbi:MAG TPA: PAS domain-containing sensor histidine kinase, partial [Prolixibacteraceae bacterium]|nr:PAS domain-containing sensor histidine kinase [Prolixibacteraceae bacterium]
EDIKPLMDNTTEMGNVARMISDYHQKNEEIEASESTKRHIIEQVQVGIIISDAASSLIITANPYACEIINAPEDAILGNITQNFFAPLSDELKNKLKNTTENLTGIESFIQSSTGEQIPILRNVTRMFMDGKHAIMETFINLSEIKSLQNKLEDEKKKHSLAMKNSGLVFCEYDFKTDEILLSDEWKFMLKGKSNSNAQNIINNIYPSDYKSITDHFSSLSSGARDTLTSEFRVQHPERGIIWVNLSVLITKRDEAHKPKQLIGLLEDITERISIQQELIKAKERAEESDRQKSAYLGNMSHKIRTPLNTIVGFSNLLTEDDISHQEKDNYINIIRHDTEQVLHLIDDIINIAKIDANQLDTNDKECSINEMFNSLSEYYKTNEKTNRIEFVTKQMLPNGKDILKTDADKLHQILNNLLNNAFKFTNEGKIELGYFINPVEEKMIIYVKDTGIGIQNEHKDKVFNHFYQANQTTEGTGLGLTISQSLVKLIGGKLNFESKEGEGSTFFVELPFKEV